MRGVAFVRVSNHRQIGPSAGVQASFTFRGISACNWVQLDLGAEEWEPSRGNIGQSQWVSATMRVYS